MIDLENYQNPNVFHHAIRDLTDTERPQVTVHVKLAVITIHELFYSFFKGNTIRRNTKEMFFFIALFYGYVVKVDNYIR